MVYNHIENVKELLLKDNITDAIDYSKNDPFKVIEPYFQFCQQNLSEECGEFDIQPARIYIRGRLEVNAAATRTANHSIIAINYGLIPHLFKFFTYGDSIFEKEELQAYQSLDKTFDLDLLSFQLTTQFTYYHELAHLIQRSPIQNFWLDELYAKYIKEGDGYSLNKHVYEFDADLHGAGNEALHMIDYWKRLENSLQTSTHLGMLLSVGAGAILSYFLLLMEKYANIYYKAGDHPHPIVRIAYIVDMFVKTAQINLPEGIVLDSKDILSRAFRFAQLWFEQEKIKEQAVKEFAKFFLNEGQNIADYINNVLIPESLKYPELVMNRLNSSNTPT